MTAPELSPEIRAMAQIEAALNELPEEARTRVLRWAGERFGLAVHAQRKVPGVGNQAQGAAAEDADTEGAEGGGKPDPKSPAGSLPEFYDQCSPQSDADKALVVSYWHQFVEGSTDIEPQRVNTELKHLGYGIGNITRAFDSLKNLKPALLVQMRKEGSSKQARKKFKVTAEGKKAVERMMAG